MVTDRISLTAFLERVEKEKLPAPVVKRLQQLGTTLLAEKEARKRHPRPPAPAGGISISEASRKYGIPNQTISRWASAGYIPIILNDGWVVYIDENRMAKIYEVYKQDPGHGSWAVKNFIAKERND